ncbi:hypothetical protein ECTW09195_4240, partial [Escherichia coli TW09195]
MLCAT